MGFLEERRRKKELQRLEDERIRQNWENAKQDLKKEFGRFVGGIPDAIQQARHEARQEEEGFYSFHATSTPSEKRVTLKAIRRELQRRQSPDEVAADLIGSIVGGFFEGAAENYSKSNRGESEMASALPYLARPLTRISDEHLHQRADFLEEQLSNPPKQLESNVHEERFREKKARRLVDAADDLFEQLERPSITRIEARKLYKRRRLDIQRDASLSPEDREDELEHLEKDFKRWLKSRGLSVFDEDD